MQALKQYEELVSKYYWQAEKGAIYRDNVEALREDFEHYHFINKMYTANAAVLGYYAIKKAMGVPLKYTHKYLKRAEEIMAICCGWEPKEPWDSDLAQGGFMWLEAYEFARSSAYSAMYGSDPDVTVYTEDWEPDYLRYLVYLEKAQEEIPKEDWEEYGLDKILK